MIATLARAESSHKDTGFSLFVLCLLTSSYVQLNCSIEETCENEIFFQFTLHMTHVGLLISPSSPTWTYSYRLS